MEKKQNIFEVQGGQLIQINVDLEPIEKIELLSEDELDSSLIHRIIVEWNHLFEVLGSLFGPGDVFDEAILAIITPNADEEYQEIGKDGKTVVTHKLPRLVKLDVNGQTIAALHELQYLSISKKIVNITSPSYRAQVAKFIDSSANDTEKEIVTKINKEIENQMKSNALLLSDSDYQQVVDKDREKKHLLKKNLNSDLEPIVRELSKVMIDPNKTKLGAHFSTDDGDGPKYDGFFYLGFGLVLIYNNLDLNLSQIKENINWDESVQPMINEFVTLIIDYHKK
jgi:hypothetical protein